MTFKARIEHYAQEAWRYAQVGFGWWVSELAGLVPEKIRRQMSGMEDIPVIHLAPDEAIVRRTTSGGGEENYRVAYSDMDDVPAMPAAPAFIALDGKDVFVERFRLPATAQGKLRQVLSFEAERRNPFRSQDTVFDFRVLEQDVTTGMLDVEWAMVPADFVRKSQAMAERLGFFPVKVGMEGRDRGVFQYVFASQRPTKRFQFTRLTAAVTIAAIFLLFSVMYAVSSHSAQSNRLTRELAAMKQEANKAEAVKIGTQKQAEALSFLGARAAETKTSAVLLELTRVLPEDTWISTFDLNGKELRLIGYSFSASSLIETLAAAPMFENAHYRGAITPEAVTHDKKRAERFDIALTVKGRDSVEKTP